MSLPELQRLLTGFYDLGCLPPVQDFVCDADVARAAGASVVLRGEVLLILEEPEWVSVGLYVDPAALLALEAAGGLADALHEQENWSAFCLITEGVSHFLYLMFRMRSDDPVSQLELEVQAEVDKYATALLVGNGVGAIRARSREVRRRIFDDVRYLDAPESEQGARYRIATKIAWRYTGELERRFLDRGELEGFWRELRRFYRRGGHAKLMPLG
ncbi:MAG: hypothetical protein OEY14_14165 [Myxococcales bacterium]|nr:hypothetical protein [Myxococcales bacterium]